MDPESSRGSGDWGDVEFCIFCINFNFFFAIGLYGINYMEFIDFFFFFGSPEHG